MLFSFDLSTVAATNHRYFSWISSRWDQVIILNFLLIVEGGWQHCIGPMQELINFVVNVYSENIVFLNDVQPKTAASYIIIYIV